MSDRFAIRKNVTMSISAFAINILLVLITYKLVISQSGLSALGLWATLMSWIFIIKLGDVGMAVAAVRYVALCDTQTEGRRIRSYVDTGIVLNTGLFLVFAIIGYAAFSSNLDFIIPGSPNDRAIARSILPLMFSVFVASNLSALVLGALSGVHLAYISSWLMILGTLIQLVSVIILVPSMGLGGLAIGQLNQHLFLILVGWIIFRRSLRACSGEAGPLLPVLFEYSALKEMVGFSLKAQFSNLMNGFSEPLAKILIGRFAGLEVLGLYEMAFKLVALPRNAAVSGVHAIVPSITRLLATEKAQAVTLYNTSVRNVARAGGCLAILSVLASPFASWFMLGHVDLNIVLFSAILAFGFSINTIGAPAFVLGTASGLMGNNIMSACLSLAILASTMMAVSTLEIPWLLVSCVAITLIFGGIFIKWRNEAILGI